MNKGHNPASGRLQSSKGGIACPGGTVVKNLPANAGDAGDLGSIPGLGNDYPL